MRPVRRHALPRRDDERAALPLAGVGTFKVLGHDVDQVVAEPQHVGEWLAELAGAGKLMRLA